MASGLWDESGPITATRLRVTDMINFREFDNIHAIALNFPAQASALLIFIVQITRYYAINGSPYASHEFRVGKHLIVFSIRKVSVNDREIFLYERLMVGQKILHRWCERLFHVVKIRLSTVTVIKQIANRRSSGFRYMDTDEHFSSLVLLLPRIRA